MLVTRHVDAVVVQAPAKVNLFLEVLRKRPDGFHEIVTCMAAVDLCDTLEFTEEPSSDGRPVRLTCDEAALPTGPENLICRAAELLKRQPPLPPLRKGGRKPVAPPYEGGMGGVERGVRIHLTKRIPLAAGLAGGSSDAAATLCGLNVLWQLGLSDAELSTLASQLGSDIPFFYALPAAWCTGRGEIVTPFRLREPLHLVLANPGVELSTAAVYKGVTVPEMPRSPEAMRQALDSGNVETIGRALFNRLQEPAERLCPEVTALRQVFERLQPAGHLMSGSGSSYFALCRDRAEAESMALEVRRQLPQARVFVVKTLMQP